MSTHLKLLALASAAMLVLPAAGHAAPSTSATLDFTENNVGGWTVTDSGFTLLTETPAGSFTTSVGSPLTAPTSVSFTGLWADTFDAAGAGGGKPFVVTSGATPSVVAELSYTTSFSGTTGTIAGDLYLGSSAPGAPGPSNFIVQGGSETISFAANGAITLDSSGAIPEPASMALFGAGLLGLGAVLRRRRRANAAAASATDCADRTT
jgi:hypothetical protein